MRPRDPGHGRDRAVRQHAGPVHQERAGLRRGVQPDKPPDVPGHQNHEGAHYPGEGHGAGTDPAGGQQGGLGAPEGSVDGRRQPPGPNLGLPLCGSKCQKQDIRE